MRAIWSVMLLSLFTPNVYADLMTDLWRENSGFTFDANLDKPTRAARGRAINGHYSVEVTIPRNSRNILKVKIYDENGNRKFPNLQRTDRDQNQDSWIYEAKDGNTKIRVTLNSDRAMDVELKKGSQTFVGSRWLTPTEEETPSSRVSQAACKWLLGQ